MRYTSTLRSDSLFFKRFLLTLNRRVEDDYHLFSECS
jgi:hypothetical protein